MKFSLKNIFGFKKKKEIILNETKKEKRSYTYLSPDFTLEEFACKDELKTPVPPLFRDNVKELVKNLQVLRDRVQKPIIINSGYRTTKHNRKIGGKANSYHLIAKACDFKVQGEKPKNIYALIESLIKLGVMKEGGLGLYDTFVHYDIRGTKARWDFRTTKD